MSIAIPKLSYDRLKELANDFLRKYNAEGKFPVPIEEILEFKLGINIIPVPGLIDFHVDAFTWSDLKHIEVDEFFFKNQLKRYRFTLAHETGHIILHPSILSSYRGDSVDDYVEFVSSVGDENVRWLEKQADQFAGMVLVPSEALKVKFQQAQLKVGSTKGLSMDDPSVRSYMADWISDYFEVSSQVVETRLVYDRLIPYIEKKRRKRN